MLSHRGRADSPARVACRLVSAFSCLVIGSGCQSATPPVAPAPSQQPAVCADAPRHQGKVPAGVQSSLDAIPWVAADPPNLAILGFLFFGDQAIRAHGLTPDGRSAKILWLVDYVRADLITGQTLDLHAARVPGPGSVHVVLPRAGINSDRPFDASHPDRAVPAYSEYPSTLDVPTGGCWRLELKSGSATGSIMFSVAS